MPLLDVLAKELGFLMLKIIHKAVKGKQLEHLSFSCLKVKSSSIQTLKKCKRLVTHIFEFARTILGRCIKFNWYSLLLYTAILVSLWAA